MRRKSEARGSPEQVVKANRRVTCKHRAAEEKIRILLEGVRSRELLTPEQQFADSATRRRAGNWNS